MKVLIFIGSYICSAIFLGALCAITALFASWLGLDPKRAITIFLIVVILRDWSKEFRRTVTAAFKR